MAAVPGAEVADFYLLQGEIEDAAGNRRSAMKALRKGVERFPALEHLRFQLATYLLAVDELDEAELVARQVLAANPRASQAYNLLGAAALRRGDPVQALSQFRSGLAVEPESIPLKLKIVDLLVETGEFQEAVHLYDELIHRGVLDRDGDRLFKAAMLHGRMGDLEGAVALFRRGLEVSPEPVHHLSLAVLLAQGGRTGEAVVELQIAVAGELSDDQRSLAESLLARLRQ
jgi:tetratricopeptide (TPR) repeat protein